MTKTTRTVVAALVLATASPAAMSHHSFRSQYDANQPVTFTGVVTKIDWMNPHVYFYVDVTDEATGDVQSWGFEMGPPHMLERRGWKRNSMQIGDTVEVHGTRARRKPHGQCPASDDVRHGRGAGRRVERRPDHHRQLKPRPS